MVLMLKLAQHIARLERMVSSISANERMVSSISAIERMVSSISVFTASKTGDLSMCSWCAVCNRLAAYCPMCTGTHAARSRTAGSCSRASYLALTIP